MPGKLVAATDVEELEGAASTGARGHVARRCLAPNHSRMEGISKSGIDTWDEKKGARTCGQAWRGQ